MQLSTLAKLFDKMYILFISFAIVYNCATKIQMLLSTLAKYVDKMYILFISFAIVYNCATENPVAIFNTCKNGLTKCIYIYFLIMHVIAQFDYHTLKKSTKYEINAELYTQVSYFVLFTFKK